MRDPLEGLAADGTIRTGVGRERVPAAFEPIIADLVGEFDRMGAPGAELHLYGSVATGQARPGDSDVDLFVIDAAPGWAEEVAACLTRRHARLCRSVDIGSATRGDHTGPGDEAYGNRVFLRHYCVSLAGPDAVRSKRSFAGDARAARGFNGDIERCLARWRDGGASAQRVARKTLVAAAGIVSVRTGTWTTDRATAAAGWEAIDATEAADVKRLLEWADGSAATADDLAAALAPSGVVHSVAQRFASEIGLWS